MLWDNLFSCNKSFKMFGGQLRCLLLQFPESLTWWIDQRCWHRSRLLDDIELLSTMVAAAQISTIWWRELVAMITISSQNHSDHSSLIMLIAWWSNQSCIRYPLVMVKKGRKIVKLASIFGTYFQLLGEIQDDHLMSGRK